MKKIPYILHSKLLADGFCFALAKGTAFLVPLLAVRVMTLSDYGILETSFAWGQQLTAVAVLGFPAAYPFFILKQRKTAMQGCFWAYGVILFLAGCLAGAFYLAGWLPVQLFFVLLLTALFAMERILSSILKTHGFGRIGVLVDSLYYFGLCGALITVSLTQANTFFPILSAFLFLMLLFLGIWYGMMLKKRILKLRLSHPGNAVKRLLSYSVPLIFSGLIIYWLIACSRIYIAMLLGNECVGIYAFCQRFFTIAILVYQFAYIMFFKKLYIVRPEQLDRNFSFLLTLVWGSAFVCFFAFLLLKPFFPAIAYAKLTLVAMEAACFMPIWCATALNEGIIARENQVMKMNLALLPQVIVFPVLIYVFRARITLEIFCLLHLCSCALVFFSQTAILNRKEIRLPKSAALIGIVTLFAVTFFFIL